MLEGVRNGSFRFIYRYAPERNPFTDLGCYLANNLAASRPKLPTMIPCR
jgi:hypothetical protein